MKHLLAFAIACTISITAIAETSKVKAETDQNLQILDLIVGITDVYSKTSELSVKVIELLGGDGVNPTRMMLSLNTGYRDSAKIYSLDYLMFYKVDRVTFLAKDVIVINYTQDSYTDDNAMTPIQISKSVKITVIRDENNDLADEIKVENLN